MCKRAPGNGAAFSSVSRGPIRRYSIEPLAEDPDWLLQPYADNVARRASFCLDQAAHLPALARPGAISRGMTRPECPQDVGRFGYGQGLSEDTHPEQNDGGGTSDHLLSFDGNGQHPRVEHFNRSCFCAGHYLHQRDDLFRAAVPAGKVPDGSPRRKSSSNGAGCRSRVGEMIALLRPGKFFRGFPPRRRWAIDRYCYGREQTITCG